MKNDISFLIGDVLNLYEHQSSFNPNMPIRVLLYLSDVYRKIINRQKLNVYSSARLTLPYPKYVVFYNGTQEEPDRIEMRLSDSFDKELARELSLEFIAVMLNINAGHNKEICVYMIMILKNTWRWSERSGRISALRKACAKE